MDETFGCNSFGAPSECIDQRSPLLYIGFWFQFFIRGTVVWFLYLAMTIVYSFLQFIIFIEFIIYSPCVNLILKHKFIVLIKYKDNHD